MAGRDYSSEVLFDGSPDGSRWLGLNRKSFLSTACIRQADIFRVLGDTDSLQQDMQRAAATAGTDATAAEALRRLGEYRVEHVGSRRAPSKPLRTSEKEAAEAKSALEQARARHDEYMERRADLERLERRARDAQLEADAVRAALAEAEADTFEGRLERVRNFDAFFPDGAPHPSPARDALAERVTTALTSWENRPGLTELTGHTAEELGRMIAESDAELTTGQQLMADPAARDRLAELYCEAQVARLFTLRSLSLVRRGINPPYEISSEKVWGPEFLVKSTEVVSQILGPYHQLWEGSDLAPHRGSFPKRYVSAMVSTFGHGSTQVMRDAIARRGLGLPAADLEEEDPWTYC